MKEDYTGTEEYPMNFLWDLPYGLDFLVNRLVDESLLSQASLNEVMYY